MPKFIIRYRTHKSELKVEPFENAYNLSERLEEICNEHSAYINDARPVDETPDAPDIQTLHITTV